MVDVWQGSECVSDFEYARFLNIPGFWTYQGCKYPRVLNMLLVMNMSGFWIYYSSKYARVTQDSVSAWICLNSFWICLIMPECVKIYLNGLAFILYLLIVIPYLKEPLTVFLKSKKFDFFYSSWKYLILLFVLDWIFLQVRPQICCYVWWAKRPGLWILIYPTNDIPNKYIHDAFLMIYLCILLLFFHFLVFHRTWSEIHKGCNSVIL